MNRRRFNLRARCGWRVRPQSARAQGKKEAAIVVRPPAESALAGRPEHQAGVGDAGGGPAAGGARAGAGGGRRPGTGEGEQAQVRASRKRKAWRAAARERWFPAAANTVPREWPCAGVSAFPRRQRWNATGVQEAQRPSLDAAAHSPLEQRRPGATCTCCVSPPAARIPRMKRRPAGAPSSRALALPPFCAALSAALLSPAGGEEPTTHQERWDPQARQVAGHIGRRASGHALCWAPAQLLRPRQQAC